MNPKTAGMGSALSGPAAGINRYFLRKHSSGAIKEITTYAKAKENTRNIQ